MNISFITCLLKCIYNKRGQADVAEVKCRTVFIVSNVVFAIFDKDFKLNND